MQRAILSILGPGNTLEELALLPTSISRGNWQIGKCSKAYSWHPQMAGFSLRLVNPYSEYAFISVPWFLMIPVYENLFRFQRLQFKANGPSPFLGGPFH